MAEYSGLETYIEDYKQAKTIQEQLEALRLIMICLGISNTDTYWALTAFDSALNSPRYGPREQCFERGVQRLKTGRF